MLAEADFRAGRYDTDYVATHWTDPRPPELSDHAAQAAALVAVGLQRRTAAAVAPGDASAWRRAARDEAQR